MVLSSSPRSFSLFITMPTSSSNCAMPASSSDQPFSELRSASYLGERCVTICMRVGLSQTKNGLLSALALSMNLREVANLVIHGLHALGIERAGVLNLLFADLAPARHHGRVIRSSRPRMHHVARANDIQEILRIVRMRRVFHRVEVIEVAKELVETVDGGQILIEIAKVILTELPGGIAHGLEYRCGSHSLRG